MHLAYAIPDHPWVDSADGAAVRIAMTVVAAGPGEGRLLGVAEETANGGEGLDVRLTEKTGAIHADLSIGADVAGAGPLKANAGISSPGFKLHGAGFIVTPEQAEALCSAGFQPAVLQEPAEALRDTAGLIRPYRNGRDLTDKPRGVLVIDAFGLTEAELRQRHPAIWQWLAERVKPERDHNSRATYRNNWWLYGEARQELRKMLAGLPRYIATVATAKHRAFQFLDATIAPDDGLICICIDDAYFLGVLSSRVHVIWALALGGTLEDRHRYNKTRCFEPFPFPDASPEQQARIREIAEELDAQRKRRQALHPELTLTGMYNVLDALRAGRALTAKEKTLHEQGLVALLKQLHDDLDAAVLAAYGWNDLSGNRDDAELLQRLAALNAQRAGEEAGGRVRWLRPEFQNPEAEGGRVGLAGRNPTVGAAAVGLRDKAANPTYSDSSGKRPWPAALAEQVAAVAEVLRGSQAALDEAGIAAHFSGKGAWKKRLPQLLETLVALGRARRVGEGYLPE